MLSHPINYSSPSTVLSFSGGSLHFHDVSRASVRLMKIESTSNCIQITSSRSITISENHIGSCNGHAIRIDESDSIHVYDNYIHPEGTKYRKLTL